MDSCDNITSNKLPKYYLQYTDNPNDCEFDKNKKCWIEIDYLKDFYLNTSENKNCYLDTSSCVLEDPESYNNLKFKEDKLYAIISDQFGWSDYVTMKCNWKINSNINDTDSTSHREVKADFEVFQRARKTPRNGKSLIYDLVLYSILAYLIYLILLLVRLCCYCVFKKKFIKKEHRKLKKEAEKKLFNDNNSCNYIRSSKESELFSSKTSLAYRKTFYTDTKSLVINRESSFCVSNVDSINRDSGMIVNENLNIKNSKNNNSNHINRKNNKDSFICFNKKSSNILFERKSNNNTNAFNITKKTCLKETNSNYKFCNLTSTNSFVNSNINNDLDRNTGFTGINTTNHLIDTTSNNKNNNFLYDHNSSTNQLNKEEENYYDSSYYSNSICSNTIRELNHNDNKSNINNKNNSDGNDNESNINKLVVSCDLNERLL